MATAREKEGEGRREEAKTRIKRGQERDAQRLENPVGSSERYRRRAGRWRETEETEGAEEEEEEEEGEGELGTSRDKRS